MRRDVPNRSLHTLILLGKTSVGEPGTASNSEHSTRAVSRTVACAAAPPEEEDDDEELDQDACPLGNGGRVADDVDDEDMEEVEGEVYDGPEDALQVLQAHSDAVRQPRRM